jgi:hypothetical protein
MSIHKDIYAMYFTHSDGSFYEVINMNSSKHLHEKFKAPKHTRWTIIISKNDETQYSYFDKNSKFISKYTKKKVYDSLSRPWYKEAMKSDKPISTELYSFANIYASGVTFANKLEREGSVFAIDYTMENLSKLLASQKSSKNLELFIFDEKGSIYASSLQNHKKVDEGIMNKFSETNMNKIIKYEKMES